MRRAPGTAPRAGSPVVLDDAVDQIVDTPASASGGCGVRGALLIRAGRRPSAADRDVLARRESSRWLESPVTSSISQRVPNRRAGGKMSS